MNLRYPDAGRPTRTVDDGASGFTVVLDMLSTIEICPFTKLGKLIQLKLSVAKETGDPALPYTNHPFQHHLSSDHIVEQARRRISQCQNGFDDHFH